MNKHEALIVMAVQRSIDRSIAENALNDANRHSVEILLRELQTADDSGYILTDFVGEILHSAHERGNLLDIADLLVDIPHNSLNWLAKVLSDYRANTQAIVLLRRMTQLEWANSNKKMYGAVGVFKALYEQTDTALEDENELVRLAAVRYVEKKHHHETMIKALTNDMPSVRRIAVWYVGRCKVDSAADTLMALLETEDDTEVLRGAIWSLGILKMPEARTKIEGYLQHSHPHVRAAAQQALGKLE